MTKVDIIKKEGENYYRLEFIKGKTKITTRGFNKIKELNKILKEYNLIKFRKMYE